MSRQSRQAELRARMAEVRSKLQVSSSAAADGQQIDTKHALSAASSILRKPKYTNAETKVETVNLDQSRNALGGLIGGYSSSEDDDEKTSMPAANLTKKRDAPALPDKSDTKKRAKFSANVHVRAITSDEDVDSYQLGGSVVNSDAIHLDTKEPVDKSKLVELKKEASEEKISDEVWDEFNALLEEGPDDSIGGETGNFHQADLDSKSMSVTAAATEAAKPKKKRKKKKESTDKSYDNEALTNVEQVSYEARVSRLVLMKSKLQKSKTNNSGLDDNNLESVDFYDPGLAFQQDDDDEFTSEEVGVRKLNESSAVSTQSISNAISASVPAVSRNSLAEILRKRRDEARQIMSAHEKDNEETKQNDEMELTDGRWF